MFQSTRLREARRLPLGKFTDLDLFQSTRLREARHLASVAAQMRYSFNPRACVRRDFLLLDLLACRASFNPRACVRRDSGRASSAVARAAVSIHAPA